MFRSAFTTAALGATLCLSSPAFANGWATASDIGAAGLGAFALGGPIVGGDWPGAVQAGASMGVAFGISEGLKHVVHEERPDHSDNHSFPSAHTAFSFAAAATMHRRYGWEVGLPATLVAAFVGVARVQANKHHWYDVVAGAAIGEASGMLITRPFDKDVSLTPWGDSHGGGLALATRF